MSNRIELNMLLILVIVIISMVVHENSGRLNNNDDRIAALELTFAEYGVVAGNNTERLLPMSNGTCTAWECHTEKEEGR